MNKQNSLSRLKYLQHAVAMSACAATLVACGGGGGGGEAPAPAPAPAPVDPSVAMRGFWSGTVAPAPDGTTRASAVIMPSGVAWVVYESSTATTAVSRVALTGTAVNTTDATVSGNGSYFRLSDGVKNTVAVTGTASTAGTLKGTSTVTGNAASTFDWTAVSGFTTAAQQADVAASWRGTVGAGAVQVTWTISGTGAVTGTSTTGCAYTGTVTPNAGIAVYNVTVAEDCAGTVKNMSGIATLASNKTSLRVVFTADSEASGGLISFAKQ